MRGSLVLCSLALGGCLNIDDAEDASRRRVGAVVGDYAGDWELVLSLGERTQVACPGDATGLVTGVQWGDPLSLSATFGCTTTGLADQGAREEATFDATLDGTVEVPDTAASTFSGDMTLRYQDTVGNPVWSATLDEGGALPAINGMFTGTAHVAVLGDVDFSGTFTLTHVAD